MWSCQKLRSLVAGLVVLVGSTSSGAALIGGATSFVDTKSGLEWLQSGFTAGMTLNAVLASDVVKTEGYRVAKFGEVHQLFQNAGFDFTYGASTGQVSAVKGLISLFGGCTSHKIGRACGDETEYWFLGAWDFSEVRNYTYQPLTIFGVQGGVTGYAYDEAYWPNTRYSPSSVYRADVATLLVRDATFFEIPEPASWPLLSVGVVMLVFLRMRLMRRREMA